MKTTASCRTVFTHSVLCMLRYSASGCSARIHSVVASAAKPVVVCSSVRPMICAKMNMPKTAARCRAIDKSSQKDEGSIDPSCCRLLDSGYSWGAGNEVLHAERFCSPRQPMLIQAGMTACRLPAAAVSAACTRLLGTSQRRRKGTQGLWPASLSTCGMQWTWTVCQ
jgi:hypothetical protein